jgi:hypothetical protein
MPEIRLEVNKEYLDELKSETGVEKTTQLTSEALALLKWAVNEIKNGRVLVSTDENGKDMRRIVMPSLERARSIRKKS